MAVDAKYGRVTVEKEPGNPFGEDEPVFILRARDVVAPGTIDHYAKESESYGAPASHVTAIRAAVHRFWAWQDAHPGLVKTPD